MLKNIFTSDILWKEIRTDIVPIRIPNIIFNNVLLLNKTIKDRNVGNGNDGRDQEDELTYVSDEHNIDMFLPRGIWLGRWNLGCWRFLLLLHHPRRKLLWCCLHRWPPVPASRLLLIWLCLFLVPWLLCAHLRVPVLQSRLCPNREEKKKKKYGIFWLEVQCIPRLFTHIKTGSDAVIRVESKIISQSTYENVVRAGNNVLTCYLIHKLCDYAKQLPFQALPVRPSIILKNM